jgi:hypothetical protein
LKNEAYTDCNPPEPVTDYRPGFVPFATKWDKEQRTLTIFELDNKAGLSSKILERIRWFGHTLYDCTGCYTQLVVADRFGVDEKLVWTVKDEIAWEYVPTGEWLSESEIERRESQTAHG